MFKVIFVNAHTKNCTISAQSVHFVHKINAQNTTKCATAVSYFSEG